MSKWNHAIAVAGLSVGAAACGNNPVVVSD